MAVSLGARHCAEPGAVVSCWDSLPWLLGRSPPAGAQHTSVTAVNASLSIPGFPPPTMVQASQPKPLPPPPPPVLLWAGLGLHLAIFKCRSQTFSAGSYVFSSQIGAISLLDHFLPPFLPFPPTLTSHSKILVHSFSSLKWACGA